MLVGCPRSGRLARERAHPLLGCDQPGRVFTPVLSVPLTGVVAWLPGRFPPNHGLHSGPRTHLWTMGKGRLLGRPEPPVGRRDVHWACGCSGRPVATAAERIVRILKTEDFEDHWQALSRTVGA